MRFVMRCVPERTRYIRGLVDQPPEIECVWDTNKNALDTLCKALKVIGDGPAVVLEDDIVLTRNFKEKIQAAIEGHPSIVIQFFSLRKNDVALGSRMMPGKTFLMNQCVYFPPGFAEGLRDFRNTWDKHPRSWTDLLVKDFLIIRKESYWLHVPSLVNHIEGPSISGPRSSKRQSPSFQP